MLKHRQGGVTFVELMVGFLIVSIASVSVTSGIYVAHGLLIRERNKGLAIQLMKGEMSYWLGRVHVSFPSQLERIQRMRRPVTISRDNAGNPLEGTITREPIREIKLPDTKTESDWFEIKVSIDYIEDSLEPPFARQSHPKPVHLELVCPMILAASS